MEKVESALDVLSRAATMVQPCPAYPASDSDSSFETPSAASSGESEGDRTVSPEAPTRDLTGKWRRDRRDRRDRRLPDYRPRENGKMALRSQSFNERRPATVAHSAQPHSEGELSDGADELATDADFKSTPSVQGKGPSGSGEAPIDMRLTRPAPPPYPTASTRPSVITRGGDSPPGSMSMCDPVIDEHFRRSLGDNYMNLYKKNEAQPGPKPNTKDRASSPILFNKVDSPRPTKIIAMDVDDASLSVDDHFAKALGDTWRQIQTSRLKATDDKQRATGRGGVDDHFSKALGDTWNKIKTSRLDLETESTDASKPTKEQTKIISRSGVVI